MKLRDLLKILLTGRAGSAHGSFWRLEQRCGSAAGISDSWMSRRAMEGLIFLGLGAAEVFAILGRVFGLGLEECRF